MKVLKILLSFTFFCSIFTFSTHTRAEPAKDYYSILVKKPEDLNQIQKLAKENKLTITYSIKELGLLQVLATDSQLDSIVKSPLVDTYNQSLRLLKSENEGQGELLKSEFPPLWNRQWDMKEITHNGESYKLFSGTKDVTVAIIDSGIDINHPDLKGNIVEGSRNLVPKGGFRNTEPEETGDINRLNDILGHGTNTAGQIAANGFMKGVAPGVGIKSYRVFGSKSGESIWIIKAIIEAAKDDSDVINLSLGEYLVKGTVFTDNGKSKNDLAEIKAYKKAIKFANKQGSAVVAAAGNESLDVNNQKQMSDFYTNKYHKKLSGSVLDIPAALPGVVTVGSVGPTKQLSSFSNYGKGFIDISAPGGDLRLLQEKGYDQWINEGLFQQEQIVTTAPDGYTYSWGNSIAAPKVSGTLALIIDKKNLKEQPNKSVRFLYNHGISSEPAYKGNELIGNGNLDVYNAVSQ
jgi:lantibiotic leader peptide-processing serine protease